MIIRKQPTDLLLQKSCSEEVSQIEKTMCSYRKFLLEKDELFLTKNIFSYKLRRALKKFLLSSWRMTCSCLMNLSSKKFDVFLDHFYAWARKCNVFSKDF